MHGEAWVNTAIQEADLLLAFGMRFDDRVTGNVKTYAPNAKKIHIDIDPAEINKNVKVDVALVGDLREMLRVLLPAGRAPATGSEWLGAHHGPQGRRRGPRHQEPARQRPPVRRARHPRPLARDRAAARWSSPTSGQHQMWEAQYYHHDDAAVAHHLRRPRHDGLRAAGGDRREDGAARRGGLGRGRRRRLPDDAWPSWRRSSRRSSTSTSPSSTTATSAWSGSGRSSSTSGATRPRRWSTRTSRSWPRPTASPRCTRRRRASEVVPAVQAARAPPGHDASSTSASSRRTRCTRWCRPATTCTQMIRRPSPIAETGADA